MTRQLPTWHIEALQRRIDSIVLVYEKAEGFAFCPSNLEKPFRVGGDYDGNWPTTAAGALNYCRQYFHSAYLERVKWFFPFVQRVNDQQDFSLEDLEIEKRSLRVISGPWPW
jgi:hypothetical protein